MKNVESLRLGLVLEVNQEVAARDQIEAREGRVAQQVMRGKEHPFAQIFPYSVLPVVFRKKTVEAFLRNVRFDRGRIQSFARVAHRLFIDIGSENLKRGRRIQTLRVLAEQDGD